MKNNIYDDLYRYTGERSFKLLLRYFLFTPGFRYVFLYRKASNSVFIIQRIFWRILLRRCMLSTGIQIPDSTIIDKGFRYFMFN
jgi:serine O-acetyltransferase